MGNSNNNTADRDRICHYIHDVDIPSVKEIFNDDNLVHSFALYYRNILYTVQNVHMIRTLLEYQPIREFCLENVDGEFGATPLMIAISTEEWDRVHAFLDCGADVNHNISKYDHVQSPLSKILATIQRQIIFSDGYRRGPYEILERLLQGGANPNLPIYKGIGETYIKSHLQYAIVWCSSLAVGLLLKYGAVTGCSVLDLAIQTKYDRVGKLKLLLAFSDNTSVDTALIAKVLLTYDYELIEIIFAYASSLNLEECDILKNISKKDYRIVKLLMIVYPQTLEGEELPTLFDIITLRLKFEDIRSEICDLKF
jgi:hypothetical protein